MSSGGNGQPSTFQVRHSKKILELIKKLHQTAHLQGRGQQFLDALRFVYERLQRDPRDLGEPLYRLPALHLVIFHVLVKPIVVDYAVHEERPLVLIQGVRLLD